MRPLADWVGLRHGLRCLGGIGALAALTLAAASTATASSPPVKAGQAFTGPTVPSIRSLQASGFRAPLLVEFERSPRGAAAELSARLAGARLVSRRLDIWLLQPDTARRLLPSLIRTGGVTGVERNRISRPARRLAFSDPLAHYGWWRTAVGADAVSAPGPSVPITILDSGVDASHPEFQGSPLTLLNQQVLFDSSEDFHGTGVASVAAAPANGVGIVGLYPGANLWAYDLRDLSDANIIAGLDTASRRGRSVINMSFGSTEYSAMVEQAALVAFGTGSILVASAGNELGQGNPVEYPASLNHVLTVAATDEGAQPTSFSNSNDAVDLAAPGQDIVVAAPFSFDRFGWVLVSGTSYSSPITAAAAAWVWSARRSLDHTQIFDLMRFSARDIWKSGYDPETGFGLLNLPTALSQRAPSPDPHEPNEDIYMIKANGLFKAADPALTRAGHGAATLTARLDYTEDPEDVYRVYVPARRTVTIRVTADDDVDLETWRPSTKTVHARGADQQRDLIAASTNRGKTAEVLKVRNASRRASVIFADVFVGKATANAGYRLRVTTSRK